VPGTLDAYACEQVHAPREEKEAGERSGRLDLESTAPIAHEIKEIGPAPRGTKHSSPTQCSLQQALAYPASLSICGCLHPSHRPPRRPIPDPLSLSLSDSLCLSLWQITSSFMTLTRATRAAGNHPLAGDHGHQQGGRPRIMSRTAGARNRATLCPL
jgi:hypothetical protein